MLQNTKRKNTRDLVKETRDLWRSFLSNVNTVVKGILTNEKNEFCAKI